MFQKYVILNSNKTRLIGVINAVPFQKYVILNSNKTYTQTVEVQQDHIQEKMQKNI